MNKPINDNEINPELTEKLNQNPKYELYKNWLRNNGVLWKGIEFPVAFGPSGVVGVAASRDIPACAGIIAVPNKLLVTLTKVKQGELGTLIQENPSLFKKNTDGDFNILTLFVLREKIKGEESFYYPMINVIDDSTILLHWDPEDIKELEDPYILKETKEFEGEMDKTWEDFIVVFRNYPHLFPLDKFTKQDFFWCYEAVMTRCFGWSLPTTMLVPMADFLNHSADGTTHYMVNKKFEKNEDDAPSIYVIKKRKVELSLFKDEGMKLSEEDQEIYFASATERISYVKKYVDYLSEGTKQKLYDGSYTKEDQKSMVQEVNLNILEKDKNRQVWDLSWFTSSDEEDNDTEEEEEESDDDEEGETKESAHKGEMEKLKHGMKNETPSKQQFKDEQVKESPSKGLRGTEKPEEEKGEEGDDEEDEEDNEEEDENAKLEREHYKYGKGIVTEKFSPTKYMKYNVSEREKEEVEKLKRKPVIKSEPVSAAAQEESEGEASDDSDWTWFEDADNENYFVVATHPYLYYKQGDQIFNCYGRRTNRFLLMWYGFCLQDNRYNSLSFRLWMNKSSLQNSNPPKKILFKDYISEKEWENKAVSGVEDSNPEELTKELKIKPSRLCEDALGYLRAQLLLTYRGPDFNQISVTMPTSIPYELFVIDYATTLFKEIKKQFSTTIEQDAELLKDPKLNWKKRFAVTYRMEQKKIADAQIKLLTILSHILEKIKTGVSLRDAYMEPLKQIDVSYVDFIEHRRKIANYLKQFHNHSN